MRYMNLVALAALAVAALLGLGASGAAATILEVGGIPKNEIVEITASLESGTSSILTSTNGETFVNTCTKSHVNGQTSSPFAAASVTGPLSSLTFENCWKPVTVHLPGKLEVTWTSGTNGTVASEGAEVTVGSIWGTVTCTTGSTTYIGTLTGAKEGNATVDINAVLLCSLLGMVRWQATYTVTSPSGLGVLASATTLEVGGKAKNESVSLTASLKPETKATLKDTFGISQNICTTSHVHGATSTPFTGSFVTGPLSSMTYENCTRPVVVHAPGKLEFTWTSGTNASVASEETTVTFGSPVGTLTCETGATTKLGTLTGVSSGNATMDINAVINCSGVSTAKWEATYLVTSPEGLGAID